MLKVHNPPFLLIFVVMENEGNVISGDMAAIQRFDYLDNWISQASTDNYFQNRLL